MTDELGDVPPPLHAWTAPVVEDMLQETRAGLTEAVVIGPGRAILFYGRCSMGEGLKADEARGTAFLLGCPQVNLPAQQPFRFNTTRASPPGDQSAHEVPEDRWTP